MSSVPQERLTMLALGIRGDQPQDSEQPPLIDGVHLRWAPAQELGFPWHGFYLFRRETRPSRPRCLKRELIANPPQSARDPRYVTPIGTLSGAKPLVFTDDFPDSGVVEADLFAPLRFNLPPGVETGRFDLRVGFRETLRLVRTCVDFRRLPLGSGPTPRTEQGAVFTVQPVNVVAPAPDAAIEQWDGGPPGLEFTAPVTVTYRLDIALPCRATKIDLLLSNRDAIAVQAFEADGASTGSRRFEAGALQVATVILSGKAIDRVTIESTSVDSALLHEVCWECPMSGGGTDDGVEVRVDFTNHGLLEFPNPVIDQGVTFESQEEPPKRAPLAWFEKLDHDTIGLHDRARLAIHLPCATARAEMLITKATDGTPGVLHAFNEDGSVAQREDISAFGKSTFVVTGQAITRIEIDAPFADILLHTLSFRCRGEAKQTIRVRGLSHDQEVTQLDMTAEGGQVVVTFVVAEALTAIEIGSGKGALIDLCYVPTRWPLTFGWETIPGFQYPLCLPVAEEDYPCPSRPTDPDAARNLALSRVTYPDPPGREQGFWSLHSELVRLVRGGPAGGAMADRTRPASHGAPISSPATQESPSLVGLRPLDLVYLASLQPAYAQMLGLYFVDQDVAVEEAFDYLLLADPTGVLGGTAESALAWVATSANTTDVDVQLLLDRRAEPRAPIAAPRDGRAYALPGGAVRQENGIVPDVAGNIGLWWPLPPEVTTEEPDRIIFYYVRRAFLGPTRPFNAPAASQYLPALGPILVSEPDPPIVPDPESRSSDWPPPGIALYAVDANLPEGWYSYRLAGQDLFGRRSALGPPAEWWQWDPSPETPPPWYYQPTGHRSIDSFAVGLLDKVPPPSPLGVEAWALDPLDRWLFADAAYEKWRKEVADNRIGLRVRWRWTLMQQLQAPDTREFRVYYQPGRWNAILATTTAVSAASPTESFVDLDIADTHATDAFAGTRLRVGNDDFAVLGSQPGAKLRLRVQHIGAAKEIPPVAGKGCTIAIPELHKLWVDTGRPPAWKLRLDSVPYDPPARIVVDPSKDVQGRLLTHEVFNGAPLLVAGSTVTVPVPATPPPPAPVPPPPDLAGIQPWIDHLHIIDAGGASETFRIVQFNATLRTVTVEGAPSVIPVKWTIGRPAREYEIFLDAPDTGKDEPFEPSLAEPVVYAQIAVSAADDKPHVADTWPTGTSVGNESRLSPSATVYRVLQEPPKAPGLPALPDRLFATPADWHDRSYSTFRFLRADHLRVHILRALDDTLFQRDWLIRETRRQLDPIAHADFFPDDSSINRAVAATALNAITSFAQYATLSVDARKVLATLPGNEGIAPHLLVARDWLIRRTRTSLTSADTDFFPEDWTPATANAAADDLKVIASLADYAKLDDKYNALRVLASLPGNEAAFTQITLEPLEMSDPDLKDARRADDLAEYVSPNTDIRAYTDTLPGRATNRYFYRAAFVDGAQNQSALSVAGPPVYLQELTLPAKPLVQQALGGDRHVVLEWRANRESGMHRYLVYRVTKPEDGRDIRLMGSPVADLPATTLSTTGGAVNLGQGTDIVTAERVYAAVNFDPTADLLQGQSAPQYLPAPVAVTGSVISGLTSPDGTEVVVIYKDSHEALQTTPQGNASRTWRDHSVSGLQTYYYRIVGVRIMQSSSGYVSVRSLASDLISARAFDLTPPAPPAITVIEWVRVADDGTIHAFSAPNPEDHTRRPAVRLKWVSPDPQLSCLVQFRSEPGGSYVNGSQWLPRGVYEYVHPNDLGFQEQEYRIKVLSPSGNANIEFAPAVLAAAP